MPLKKNKRFPKKQCPNLWFLNIAVIDFPVAERSRSTNPLVHPFLSAKLETEPKNLYNKKSPYNMAVCH